MKKLKSLAIITIGFIILWSCNTKKTTIKNWEGTYIGILPCADCPGIQQVLTLKKDSTYILQEKYLESPQVPKKSIEGRFSLEGNIITFIHPTDSGTYIYQLADSAVRYLNSEGKPVNGKLADKYILHKQSGNIKATATSLKTETPGIEGKYFGILPCADCGGIEYALQLNSNRSFQLITHYLTNEPSKYDTLKGNFTYNMENKIIVLGNANKYKVEDNQLRYLNMDGAVIKGNLADAYVLHKEGNTQIENKKWNVITLGDKKIEDTASNHFYIEFDSKSKRVQVRANCNLISFAYRIVLKTDLHIDKGISTMMACKDSQDHQMMEMMTKATQAKMVNEQLKLLDKDGKVLATFVLEA